MADPCIDGCLCEPIPFHLGLPRFDVGRRDRHRLFAREVEEGEHGVRLVAPDVLPAQARSARGGVSPESDGVRERGIARLARNQGHPLIPGPGFSLLTGLAFFHGGWTLPYPASLHNVIFVKAMHFIWLFILRPCSPNIIGTRSHSTPSSDFM